MVVYPSLEGLGTTRVEVAGLVVVVVVLELLAGLAGVAVVVFLVLEAGNAGVDVVVVFVLEEGVAGVEVTMVVDLEGVTDVVPDFVGVTVFVFLVLVAGVGVVEDPVDLAGVTVVLVPELLGTTFVVFFVLEAGDGFVVVPDLLGVTLVVDVDLLGVTLVVVVEVLGITEDFPGLTVLLDLGVTITGDFLGSTLDEQDPKLKYA